MSSKSNLSGKVPSDIYSLSKLVSLDLSRNDNMRLEDACLQRLIQNQTKQSELFLVEVDVFSFTKFFYEFLFFFDISSTL